MLAGGATIRIGTCSWADEGLVKRWYPRGVSSPAARLAYYAERFDVVEVDSPFYRLPSPETAAKWAERTPAGFVFHAKASGEMTGHREAGPRDRVRASSARRSRRSRRAGKLRGVLLQYPPRFVKSRDGARRARRRGARSSSRSSRSSSSATARGSTRTSARTRSRSSSGTASPTSRSTRPRTRARTSCPRIAAATHPVAYVRFHGRNWRTWNLKGRTSAERFDWMYDRDELEEWVEPLRELAAEAEEVYALMNNNRYDYAPRSAHDPPRACSTSTACRPRARSSRPQPGSYS